MPAEIVLHDYWRSSASWRVRIALNLSGLPWRSAPVDLTGGEQAAPAHLARNPQALVPALEIDGLVLTQSLAILEYLQETGRVRLLPDAPGERARARAAALAVAAEIQPLGNLRVLRRVEAMTGRPEARAQWSAAVIREGLVAVEALLAAAPPGPWAMGAAVTLADLCIVPQLYNADRWGAAWADLPRLNAVAAAAAAHPAFRAAHADAVRPEPAAS